MFPKIISVNSFKNILYKKSEYLRNLEERKNKSYRIINKTKNELLKQKILKSNIIQRNYKIFSKNEIFIPKNKSPKFYFTPNIKQVFLSSEESEYYPRYKKKDFDIDNFSMIYKNNTTAYPIRINNKIMAKDKLKNSNYNNSKNNNKSSFDSFMTSIGNSLIYNSRYNVSKF